MRNPFKVTSSQTQQVRIHRDLVTVIKREQKRQQQIADNKFNNKKFKVSFAFASKVLGGMMK